MEILIFFLVHWFGSLFFQTFFHHRYASHGMFTMSKFWERTFNIAAVIFQGSSYLNPRAYAVMHRLHHEYSDTERDPHTPRRFSNVFTMMWQTYKTYEHLRKSGDTGNLPGYSDPPEWKSLERIAGHPLTRIFFVAGYTLFYIEFATAWWMFLLLPVHFLMGPIHGAIVNWCGHRYGYRNHDQLDDDSRNTLPFDLLTMGELFQNNHHKSPGRPNFAHKPFEFDPTYPFVRLLAFLRVIHLPEQRATRSTTHAPLAK